MEPLVFPGIDGSEFQLGDAQNMGAVSGLADDRVLAELLRLAPFDGTHYAKAILPYGYQQIEAAADPGATVTTTGTGNGSIVVSPFRAIVGSRNAVNAAPSPNPAVNYQSDALANWRDIRSGIFVGSSTSLTQTIQLAANSSGDPRFDLIYATVAVDANGPSVSRRVKSTSTGSISTQSVPSYLQCTVTIGVVQGTPYVSNAPDYPSAPADAPSSSPPTFNIPLAYVRVPNGFTSTSTVSTRDVQDCAPAVTLHRARGGFSCQPANQSNKIGGTVLSTADFYWPSGAGARPGPFLPPSMTGMESIFVEVDCVNGTSIPTNWSHGTGQIVDDSRDWRNRIFIVYATASSAAFANDPTGAAARLPLDTVAVVTQMSNSIGADGQLVASSSTVSQLTNTIDAAIGSGAIIGLYVDPSTGALKFYSNGTAVGARIFWWLFATAPFPNY